MFEWLALLCMVSGAAVPPPDADPHPIALTLDDAVALALRENYDIRNANIARVAERYALYVAHDKFRPHANAVASMGVTSANSPVTVQSATGQTVSIAPHAEILLPSGTLFAVDVQENISNPPSTYSRPLNAYLQITATQPLLQNFGIEVNMASIDIATLQERVNLLNLRSTLLTTVTNVIYAYRNFAQADLLLQIAKNAVTRSRELLEINYQMVNAGRSARAELIQVESEIALREVNQVAAESDYITNQMALLQLLAMSPNSPVAPVQEVVPEVSTPARDVAIGVAMGKRPEYASARLSETIASKNLLLAENNRRWNLNLMAQYRHGDIASDVWKGFAAPVTGAAHSFFTGLILNIPLLEVPLQQQVVDSQVDVAQAEVNSAAARNTIALQVDAACRTLDLRRRHLGLAKRARQLASQKLDNERQRLAAGRSSNFQVVRFQDDLVVAEVAEIETTIAYLNAVTNLQVQLGSLLDHLAVQIR